MSGRLASTPHSRPIRPRFAAGWLVGCALMVAAIGIASAQPPTLAPSKADGVDDRSPIPPETSRKAALAAKVPIDKDRAIFKGTRTKDGVVKGGIEDERPLASEKQNADEYQALTEVVLHANQFTAADLDPFARSDLTPDDLRFGTRTSFRLDLVRFEGKLTKARRIRATRALEDTGVAELVEAWLVPDDESPGNAVCLLLTAWPDALPKLPELANGLVASESVAIDRWATFAGYSFKLMTYPGPDADPKNPIGRGWLKAPLLIGPTVVPAAEPTPKPALDKDLRVFKRIPDDSHNNSGDVWEEPTAWNRVVLHARKFTAEQLEDAAKRDLTFADLFEDHRADYKLDLVYFKGRLIRIKKGESTPRLTEAGVSTWYEGWLVPDGEPRGNPVCIVLTDLPLGLEPKALMSVPVTFAGYSFKRMRYTSQEQDRDDPKKFLTKAAPLLIGRSVTVLPEPDGPGVWSATFIPMVLGGLLLLVGIALTMSWWFRRGDRQARAEIEAVRANPFGN